MTGKRLIHAVIDAPDQVLQRDLVLTRVSILSGVIFVFAGLVKFVFHHWELHAFRSFGLPFPSVLEIIAGVLETGGGVLLVLRRWTIPNGFLLSATMVVAFISSGIDHGDVIPSDTLAPALLIAMLYLMVRTTVSPPARGTAAAPTSAPAPAGEPVALSPSRQS